MYKTQHNNVDHFILFLFFKDTNYFINNVTADAENMPPPKSLRRTMVQEFVFDTPHTKERCEECRGFSCYACVFSALLIL